MPFRSYECYEFSESGIATYAPRTPGIYGIHDGQRLWIYIDEAQNIEMQLLAHLRGESVHSAGIVRNKPAYFTFEKCFHHQALSTREKELIREYQPSLSQPDSTVSNVGRYEPGENAKDQMIGALGKISVTCAGQRL